MKLMIPQGFLQSFSLSTRTAFVRLMISLDIFMVLEIEESSFRLLRNDSLVLLRQIVLQQYDLFLVKMCNDRIL